MASGTIHTTKNETLSPTLTKTSGNSAVSSISAVRTGNVVSISITFTNGSQTSAGSNSFVGTLSGVPFPANSGNGVGYYGSTFFAYSVTSNGALTERVITSAGYWASSDNHGCTIVYICA